MTTEYIGMGFEGGGPGRVIVQPAQHELDTGYDNPDLPSHSPDGFQCGYAGSGPAQLAAALLYDVTGDAAAASRLKRPFMQEVVTGLPNAENDEGVSWRLSAESVEQWVEDNDR